MDTIAWIVQVLLGLVFLAAGSAKLFTSREKLLARMAWVEDFSPNIIKAIGFVEVLGGIGLILPSLTRVLPVLTPLAAVGLILTMIGAALTHLRRKEYPMIIPNIVLLALAAFVAYARFVAVPLT